MKNLIHHSLITSAVLATSLLNSVSAVAQSVEVQFNGNISPIISVGVTQNPITELDNTSISLNTFVATTPAIVTATITAPIVVMVSPPIPDGMTDPNGTEYTGYVRYNGTQVTHGQQLLVNDTGTIDLEISMRVIRPQAFPPGNYRYRVTVNITGQ